MKFEIQAQDGSSFDVYAGFESTTIALGLINNTFSSIESWLRIERLVKTEIEEHLGLGDPQDYYWIGNALKKGSTEE